ncbi:MaoC family dehydratase [Burkholderia sp. BCC0419]|uniref:MaoC family dehydratase n=1 Tax=Burkholderia sp. BCC0419 TaxID=486878 RepID=UPI0015887CD6|nr:MaoC family dehydratase [Burkholderia sp. BCC0419]
MTETKVFAIDTLDALPAYVGREVAVSPWFPILQDRVTRFAEVTEDNQWIHVDPERARRESPYGTTVAHGYLTLSLLPCLASGCIRVGGVRMGVNYGLNRVRFVSPVRVGDSIRARFTLRAADPVPGGMQVVWHAVVEVGGSDKPACVAEMVSRRYV